MPGAQVWLQGIPMPAEALSAPDRRGEMDVSFGGLRARVGVGQVVRVDSAPKRPPERTVVLPQAPYARSEIEVRGQTLDEFRQAVDKLLDGGIEVSLNIIGGLGGATFQERHTEETVAFVQSLPRGVKVFYSGLAVSPASHYARKQSAIFGGEVTPEEMSRQMRVFEQELKAAEYLFVPM